MNHDRCNNCGRGIGKNGVLAIKRCGNCKHLLRKGFSVAKSDKRLLLSDRRMRSGIGLAPGVGFVSYSGGLHVASVDLALWKPKVTPLVACKLHDVAPGSPLVVNGDRFGGGYDGGLSGLNISDGVASVSIGRTDHESGIEFGDGYARIRKPDPAVTADDLLQDGVINRLAGFPWLIKNGEVNPLILISEDPRLCERHPRTITALNSTGSRLTIFVVDGRAAGAPGATMVECAQMMQRFGVSDAVSHDGGASSAFVSYGEYLTDPSDWWDGDEYDYRSVGNALVLEEI